MPVFLQKTHLTICKDCGKIYVLKFHEILRGWEISPAKQEEDLWHTISLTNVLDVWHV